MADYTADSRCKGAWLFTEGSGTTVADATGNGNTGTFNSSGHPAWSATVPSFAVTGSAAGSASYSTSGTLEIIGAGTSDTLLPYNSAFSCVGWIYPTADQQGGGDPRIFARGSFYLGIEATRNLYVQIAGGTAFEKHGPGSVLTLNAWNHVAWTWDGNSDAGNHGHIYVNGSEVSSYASYQNGVSLTSNSGDTTYIGNRSDGNRCMPGLMTEAACFNAELTALEVLDIYNYGLKPAASSSIKTINGLAVASVKTVNGLAIASVKTVNGLA